MVKKEERRETDGKKRGDKERESDRGGVEAGRREKTPCRAVVGGQRETLSTTESMEHSIATA